jgi:hypothetical protein
LLATSDYAALDCESADDIVVQVIVLTGQMIDIRPSAMTGGAVAAIVIVAETDFVLSVTDVAVTVTVAGVGTALGAV